MMVLNLFLTFFKIGLFSFGGGYAMIPLIQREIVTLHRWLTMSQFIDVIAISQVTPGPIAINAATFVGYKVAGVWGSAAATAGVVMPSVLVSLGLTWAFLRYRSLAVVKAMFTGIRPAVVALIVAATLSILPSSITNFAGLLIALLAFLAIRYFKLDPILALVLAAAIGILIG
ncbi:MAG: chromate transporter [Bacillota bacterium]|nr:chromate transporter [Bacillota bacterium]MDK2924277.1 chromate transporter [Bacillota bacterium]